MSYNPSEKNLKKRGLKPGGNDAYGTMLAKRQLDNIKSDMKTSALKNKMNGKSSNAEKDSAKGRAFLKSKFSKGIPKENREAYKKHWAKKE